MKRKVNDLLTDAQYVLKQKGLSQKALTRLCAAPQHWQSQDIAPKDSAFSLSRLHFCLCVSLTVEPSYSQGDGQDLLILYLGHRSLNWTTKNLASLYFCSNLRSSPGMKSSRMKGGGGRQGKSELDTWSIPNVLFLEARFWRSQIAPSSLANHSVSSVPDSKWNAM